MSQLRIQPEAQADVLRAAAWYEEQRIALGVEFVLEVDAALARVVEFPEMYAVQYRRARRALIRRFPYAVYFRFDGGVVEVFAVLHQRSTTLRWVGRLS